MNVDFVVVGNPKSGSSSLYDILSLVEDVEMSKMKEPGLFFLDKKNFIRKYKVNFSNKENMIRGEASVGYSINEEAITRIINFNPKVKVILMIRNPIERTYSHYWHKIKMNELELDFNSVLNKNPNHEIFKFSRYLDHKKTLLKYIPEENILIVPMEKLNNDYWIYKISQFLSIQNPKILKNPIHSNKSTTHRSKILNKFINYIRTHLDLSLILPKPLYLLFRKIWHRVKALNQKNYEYPKMSDDIRNQLEEIFAFEIQMWKEIISDNEENENSYPRN